MNKRKLSHHNRVHSDVSANVQEHRLLWLSRAPPVPLVQQLFHHLIHLIPLPDSTFANALGNNRVRPNWVQHDLRLHTRQRGPLPPAPSRVLSENFREVELHHQLLRGRPSLALPVAQGVR